MRILCAPVLLALAVAAACVRTQAADSSCLACHKQEAQQFTGSAHGQSGVVCVDCHGGNPQASDETAHATDNFKRPGKKQAVAEMCAHCHGDVRRMNPYGLPTDQLDRYKTSKHGEQLFEHGDQKVAVCTDCHGVHDIAKVKSPQSHVYPTHIPQTCGRCHSDEALMIQYKLPSDVVAQYKTSYHATMLFEKGDLSAPTCVTCHGSHGATPPGTTQVGEVCGKCHGRQRELFVKSPHAEAAFAGVFDGCVACHGNHAIQKASVHLYEVACVKCHAKDPQQLERGDTMVKLLRTAAVGYDHAVTVVHDATVRGLATDDEQLLLQEAKTQLTQMEVQQHTLSPEQIEPLATHTREIVAVTEADVAHLDMIERWKRKALVPIWMFLGVMAALFWAKRRQIGHGDKS